MRFSRHSRKQTIAGKRNMYWSYSKMKIHSMYANENILPERIMAE